MKFGPIENRQKLNRQAKAFGSASRDAASASFFRFTLHREASGIRINTLDQSSLTMIIEFLVQACPNRDVSPRSR